ncbi:MAG: ATP-grasp domain-containing protein [Dactylosporangium sp.]|nr:ATP-grasp domain-containing protein [Dactylosporangium sp.]NNJ61799.1 ATP-grasp domain-containing protein [Dactylosporangium sp.]
MRILVTDALHPVTSDTMGRLRDTGVVTWIGGAWPGGSAVEPPPGLDTVEAVPDSDAPEYPHALLRLAVAHRVAVVMPWSDADARIVAGHRSAFAQAGVGLLCPPAVLVELGCDKWRTIAALRAAGLSVPRSRLVTDADQLADAAGELGYPTTDLVLKMRDLAGSRGIWAISTRPGLAADGPLPTLCLPAMAAQLRSRPGGWPEGLVVQELVTGTDVSIDLLARRGTLLAAACRTRRATSGGLCVSGEVFALDGALAAATEHLVVALGWDGIGNLQAIVDPDGRAVFYEINPRAAGSVGLSAAAGLDLLAGAVRAAAGFDPWPGHDRYVTIATRSSFRRHWSTQQWATTPCPVPSDDPDSSRPGPNLAAGRATGRRL